MNNPTTTGYDTVDHVISLMSFNNGSMTVTNDNQTHFYQVRAAIKCGYFEPFSAEQTALNSHLAAKGATKEMTEEAWALYHQLKQK